MQKAGLLLVGLVVAASTVYAVVLRATTAPDSAATAVVAATPSQSVLLPRVEPRTWGRLVMLDEPSASPGFSMIIRTPPVVISAAPPTLESEGQAAPVHKQVIIPPVVEVASDTGGVMARFKAPPPAASDLPEAPDRAAISRVMGSVRTEIQECYDRGMVPGQVDLVLTVAGESGDVQRARVSATSSTATCIQRVARTLRFPRFARETITIRYPYSFR